MLLMLFLCFFPASHFISSRANSTHLPHLLSFQAICRFLSLISYYLSSQASCRFPLLFSSHIITSLFIPGELYVPLSHPCSHLISSHLLLSQARCIFLSLISSHLISSHLISSHLISSYLILSYFILSCLYPSELFCCILI